MREIKKIKNNCKVIFTLGQTILSHDNTPLFIGNAKGCNVIIVFSSFIKEVGLTPYVRRIDDNLRF